MQIKFGAALAYGKFGADYAWTMFVVVTLFLVAVGTCSGFDLYQNRIEIVYDQVLTDYYANYSSPSVCACRKDCFLTNNCTGISLVPQYGLHSVTYWCLLTANASIQPPPSPLLAAMPGVRTIYRRRRVKVYSFTTGYFASPADHFSIDCTALSPMPGFILNQADLAALQASPQNGTAWLPVFAKAGSDWIWGTTGPVVPPDSFLWTLMTSPPPTGPCFRITKSGTNVTITNYYTCIQGDQPQKSVAICFGYNF